MSTTPKRKREPSQDSRKAKMPKTESAVVGPPEEVKETPTRTTEDEKLLQKMRDIGRPFPFAVFDQVKLSPRGRETERLLKPDSLLLVTQIRPIADAPVANWRVHVLERHTNEKKVMFAHDLQLHAAHNDLLRYDPAFV